MPMLLRRFYILLAVAVVVFGSVSCQPAQKPAEPTLTPVVLATPTAAASPTVPATATAAAYPPPQTGATPGYPVDQPGGETTPAYPAPGDGSGTGPAGGVPAIENRGKVTAKLIESAPDPDNANFTRLHALILTSEDVEGMQNFTSKLVNTEADLYIQTGQLPELKAGDMFEAVVSYNGDEHGGKYYVKEIQKQH
jgi:hypothetical protein